MYRSDWLTSELAVRKGRAASVPQPPKPQIGKFRDLARELEWDDDEAAFAEKMERIAKAPREPKPSPQPRQWPQKHESAK
jgi:hypothetical protein